MQRAQTTSAVEATHVLFDQALPEIPIWGQERIEYEFEGFQRAWGSKRLIPGTKESLRKLVQSNLEKTTQEFGFHFFTVDVMPQLGCGQVMATAPRFVSGVRNLDSICVGTFSLQNHRL